MHGNAYEAAFVQQNGQIGGRFLKTVLKNGSNLHLVNLFEIKNLRQRFFDLKSQKIVAVNF